MDDNRDIVQKYLFVNISMLQQNNLTSQRACNRLNQRVLDLIQGKGTETSRRLTKELLKTLPSVIDLVPDEYQERLRQILDQDDP